ncbi:MAG TPA: hypothetical protein VFH22_05500 [Rhodocyclaceae bacterium]|nr:hypothetical protein [Rhodocyclaceae bacterium]
MLIAAIGLAEIGQRALRLPRLTGYVLAGILTNSGVLLFELGSKVDPRGLGGPQYQDPPSVYPDSAEHRNTKRHDQLTHEIVFADDASLIEIYEKQPGGRVTSIHHPTRRP